VRVVTRVAVVRLRAARARREVYVGPWLPEPVLTGPGTAEPLDAMAATRFPASPTRPDRLPEPRPH
jgi:hypothetical protein